MVNIRKYIFAMVIIIIMLATTRFLFKDALLESGNSFLIWFALIIDGFFIPTNIIAFFASLGGILAGFINEERNKRVKFNNKVYRIVPYIIIELEKNLKLLSSFKEGKNLNFTCYYFDIYKNDLSEWSSINIIPLVEIYGYLKSDKLTILNNKNVIEKIMDDQLILYNKWYLGNGPNKILPPKNSRNQLSVTIQRYRKYNFAELDEILKKWERNIEVMKLMFKEEYDEI